MKDDLAIVKPTLFLSVPRLYSRFYEVLTAKFNEVKGMTKKALDYALSTKLDNLKSTGVYTHRIYDMVFFAKTREALGGRVRLMVSGSAPLLPEVQNFLKVCMCAPLLEGYGQTESTGAMLITNAEDPVVSHVGGPVVKLHLFSVVSKLNWSTFLKCSIVRLIKMLREILPLEVRSGAEDQESFQDIIMMKSRLSKL